MLQSFVNHPLGLCEFRLRGGDKFKSEVGLSVGLPTDPNIVGIGMQQWVKVTTAALMETLTFGPIFLIYELLFWHNVAMVSKRKGRRLSGQPASGTRAATGTYQTRVSNYSGMDRSAGDAVLAAYGELYSRVQRKLVAAVAAGRSATSLKSAYLKRYGIPARMLNGARVSLEGKVASVREQQRLRAVDLSARIKRAEKQIAGLGEQSSWDQVHQKKRRLVNLRSRLAALEADISADRTRLCFGSKRLWRKQHVLEATVTPVMRNGSGTGGQPAETRRRDASCASPVLPMTAR